MSIPEAPGPPGLTKSVPIGFLPVAGIFAIAMVIVLPFGFV